LPRASIVRTPAGGFSPGSTRTMRPSSTSTVATRGGAPVASNTVAPTIARLPSFGGAAVAGTATAAIPPSSRAAVMRIMGISFVRQKRWRILAYQ
jgi:hypothetical protein